MQMHTKNNKGNMVIASILATAIISALVVTNTSTISSVLKNRVYRLEAESADQIYTRVINLLQDQRYCSQFFDTGYLTSTGKYNFTKSKFPSGFMQKKVTDLQNHLKSSYSFEVNNIQLTNQQIINTTEPMKVFDVSVEIKSNDTSGMKSITSKVLGSEKLLSGSRVESQRVFLTLGQRTGKCSLQKGLNENILNHSQKLACDAIGGQYNTKSGNCGVRRLKVDTVTSGPYQYEITRPDIIQTQFNFTEALCNMELNLMRKDRTSTGGYQTDSRFAWTSLCQKPEWSGCRYNNQNIPNGTTVHNVREYSSKMKKVARWAQDRVSDTVYLRANKIVGPNMSVVGSLAKSQIDISGLPHVDKMAIHSILGGVGLGLLTGDVSMGVDTIVASMILGPVLGPIAVIGFAMKCDKGRAYVTRVCKDGQMEVTRVRLRKQKYKKFKCRWRSAGTANVPSSEVIAEKILTADGKPPQPIKIPVVTFDNEEKEIINDINSLKSINDITIALKDTKDAAEVPIKNITLDIPKGLSASEVAALKEEHKKRQEAVDRISQAEINKETGLINSYVTQVTNAIKSYTSTQNLLNQSKSNLSSAKSALSNAVKNNPAGDHSSLQNKVNSLSKKVSNLTLQLSSLKNQLISLRASGVQYINASKSYPVKTSHRSDWEVTVVKSVNEITKNLKS